MRRLLELIRLVRAGARRLEDELREEIRLTVLHEIAHYFGMDEEEIEDLGY